MSESPPQYTERRGLTQRPYSGSSMLYLLVAGALVAGAGVAGLHYRESLWDDPAQRDYSASPGEPSSTELTIAHLSHNDEMTHTSTVLRTEDALDGGGGAAVAKNGDTTTQGEALKADGPKPKAPTPPHSHGRTKPKADDQAAGDSFAKPE